MQNSIPKNLRDVPLRRAGVAKLSEALGQLHGSLVEHAKADYVKTEGPIGGPGEMLQLLTQHEAFAWLRPLSSHLAELEHADATNDEEKLRDELVAVDALLAPTSPFAGRYFDIFQRNPGVVMAHAAVKAALRGARLVD